ncbi:hypothetical protein CIPAW_11G005600 [Carya illinoinensis]|uniref:Uncharacterized protein n=1 Tax=Carya illinoinensis TaxID=32201 RepID=A0A8T1NTI1_CARIL|nr:hypothetical protein CIPAW_11G005600 [Carya illinoinensis]
MFRMQLIRGNRVDLLASRTDGKERVSGSSYQEDDDGTALGP